jgi:phosphotransferase system IIB component
MEIIGYPTHTISNDGVIISPRLKRPLQHHINNNYHRVGLWNGTQQWVLVHRLVYQHYGKDWNETQTIDHIDGNTHNNHISNLRIATQQQQQFNKPVCKTNKLGVKGVTKAGKRYRAMISINKKQTHLGIFDTIEEARQAYETKARELHGEFFNAQILSARTP